MANCNTYVRSGSIYLPDNDFNCVAIEHGQAEEVIPMNLEIVDSMAEDLPAIRRLQYVILQRPAISLRR